MPEHCIGGGGYSTFPGPKRMCVLHCLCGFKASGNTWESAEAKLDEHISEASDD